MNVLAYDKFPNPEVNAKYVSLDELYQNHFGGVYYVFLKGCYKNSFNGIYAHTWQSFVELNAAFLEILNLIEGGRK